MLSHKNISKWIKYQCKRESYKATRKQLACMVETTLGNASADTKQKWVKHLELELNQTESSCFTGYKVLRHWKQSTEQKDDSKAADRRPWYWEVVGTEFKAEWEICLSVRCCSNHNSQETDLASRPTHKRVQNGNVVCTQDNIWSVQLQRNKKSSGKWMKLKSIILQKWFQLKHHVFSLICRV